MSVTTMSLVFNADMTDLPYEKDGEKRNAKASTAKLLLLAYADHANDNGKGAYPGYDKLELKTALSRQGIADTLDALKQNEFMIFEGVSELGTNSYQLNLGKLRSLVKPLDSDESSHLTGKSQATRRKPSINHPSNPSSDDGKALKANQIPEVVLFRSVTRRYPNSVNFEDVIASVSKVKARLRREVTRDDLLPFYKAWTSKGYNPAAITWLEWAETGQIPVNGTWKSQRQTVADDWLARKEQEMQNGRA